MPPPRKSGEAQRRRTSSSSTATACVGSSHRRAGRDELVPVPDLRSGRGDVQGRRRHVPGVDPLRVAPRPDPAHRALGRAADLDGTRVAGSLAQRRQVVPERGHEPAVPAARAVTAQFGIDDEDVGAGFELLDVPGRPHPEVAAADDENVGADVSTLRRLGLDRPEGSRGLLEPPAGARMPEVRHGCDPRQRLWNPDGIRRSAAWTRGPPREHIVVR